ncbi:MAG TPA: C4-type zinc ribbon domain-containing protein [Actinocrinis sp.]|uniref:zinc ribbon domain-containing protein n=1 Tax=Actinocrinis sp. TaxID=1920516 RepID=UPI002DDCC2A2|nr:C4-type zinc ribbon domain-containing protein [Actinocrinis sp.]HEV3172130.1 C4-type zinc ribbon domain-containing protein [Actinocrinis sp.]
MNAEPADQLRLLDLQALDSKLGQLAHRRRTLPQLSEVAALETRASQLRDLVVAAATAESDLAREQKKAEADVDQVRARAERDRKLLDSGSTGAKELSGLQSELESLAKRQSDLEDIVLDVMERTESAAARTAELTKQRDAAEVERGNKAAALAVEVDGIDKDVAFTKQQRDTLAGQVPADLLALYEKIRGQYGGIGAAAIKQRRCEGCRLELDISEINAIKAAAPDAVLRHDACRRILVRTKESGL